MVDPASQKCTLSPPAMQCKAAQQHTREAKVHFLDAGPPQEREGAPLVHLMFAPWCTRWHHDALFAAEPSDLWDAIIAVFLRFTSLLQEQFKVFAIQGRSESASFKDSTNHSMEAIGGSKLSLRHIRPSNPQNPTSPMTDSRYMTSIFKQTVSVVIQL